MDKARQTIGILLVVGVSALLVGGVVLAFGWPHDTVLSSPDVLSGPDVETVHHGSRAALIVGGLLAEVGLLLFVVGALGKGIELGVRAAGARDEVLEVDDPVA